MSRRRKFKAKRSARHCSARPSYSKLLVKSRVSCNLMTMILTTQNARYQDQLSRQRYEEQLNKQREMQERELQMREASVKRQEQEKRATMEYQEQLRRQTEIVKTRIDVRLNLSVADPYNFY